MTTVVDLTSGLPITREFLLAERPSDPEFREGCSVWISDDRGAIGLPRVSVEAVANSWDRREVQVNIAFPSGRVIQVREPCEGVTPIDSDGVARVFKAGGLEFRCDAPFAEWTVTFVGRGLDTTALAQAADDVT